MSAPPCICACALTGPQGEAKLANMSGVQRNTCDVHTALGRQQGEASAPGDGPVPLGAPPGAGMAAGLGATWRHGYMAGPAGLTPGAWVSPA